MEYFGEKWPSPRTNRRKEVEEAKLLARRERIQRTLFDRRIGNTNPIAGYDLSLHKKKTKKRNKRCWTCGMIGHKSNFCPSIKTSKLHRLCLELQNRIELLEMALAQKLKSAEKRIRKHKAKVKKNKKKKHKKLIQAMDNAVTLRILLIKDEDLGIHEGTPKWLNKALSLHSEMDPKRKKMVEKCYSRLFGRSLKEDVMDAIDFDDALGEYINEQEMDIDTGPF